uniref:Amino acid transporter transmembrane domain-containing protein n=1 Tax=Graphocephala atropunctata TaxID=36148 RepID=A0A1B6KB22_9HEMI
MAEASEGPAAAPKSEPPTSVPPTSGPPTSGPPTSGPPTSGPPTSGPLLAATITSKKRKGFVSPASSFVDNVKLESEYFTEEGRQQAQFYDPYAERKIKKPITDSQTIIHMLKGSVGAGILAMPIAFSHAGVAVSLVGSSLIASLVIYATDTLLNMQLIQCRRLRVPFLTLPRSMKIGLLNGPRPLKKLALFAPCLVDFFLVTYQLGTCTAYVIFIAKTLKNLAEPRITENVHLNYYLLMIFIPVVLINYIRNLKKLTVVSLTANILTIFAFSCCFYYIFGVGPFRYQETNLVSSVTTWPLFVGTSLFALYTIGVLIVLEHNMEKPQHFLGAKGILPMGLTVVAVLYILIGFFGYVKYGNSGVRETIFASLPKNEWLSLTAEGVYGICIFGTHPLQCYVSLEIIWGNYLVKHIKNPERECIVEYILRTFCVFITFVGAVLIPHVDIMISLVGAFCLSTLGMICPFLLELCTLWPDQLGRYYYIIVKDIVLIILGFGILIMGTYTSLYSFISSY